ncbi:MAG TPA: response regulator [Terriglobales bacterium]|nr:response regulator [Terriglobales bacterium]
MCKQTTVLYVDDNSNSRRLLTAILETKGFAVIGEEDPVAALEQAKKKEFDLALLDYQMPRMKGTELARELKRMDSGVPVVLISGLAGLPSEELTFVNVHLGKGTRLECLLDTIRKLAQGRVPVLDMASMQWGDAT